MTRIVAIILCGVMPATPVLAQCQNSYRPTYKPVAYNQPYKKIEVIKEVTEVYIPVAVFQYLPALQAVTGIPIQQMPPVTQVPQPPTTISQPEPGYQPPQQVAPPPQPVSAPQPQPLPGDEGPPPLIMPGEPTSQPQQSTPATGTIPQQVANMLAGKSCVNCHTQGTKVSGDTVIFAKKDNQLLFQPTAQPQAILDAVSGDRPKMPPSAKGDKNHPDALKPNEIALLRQWATKK